MFSEKYNFFLNAVHNDTIETILRNICYFSAKNEKNVWHELNVKYAK